MKILFTNAGRRTYMITFALAANSTHNPITVYVADPAEDVPTKHLSPDTIAISTPRVDEGGAVFAKSVLQIAKENNINLVIPLSDLELLPLAEHKKYFEANGIKLLVSNKDVIINTMNKRNADIFCNHHNIPTPKSFYSQKDFNGIQPCVIKPIVGSGSNRLRFVDESSGNIEFDRDIDMIQERIFGDEFGIDILNDFNGDFITATVKRKILMRAGETDRSLIVQMPELVTLAKKVSEAFRHIGNLDVDVIVDAMDNPYCIDFNARFGGGYPTTHLSGMNYLGALIDMARGKPFIFPETPRDVTVVKGVSVHVIEKQQ